VSRPTGGQPQSRQLQICLCRALAHAVSRRVPAKIRSCGTCGGQSGTGVGRLRVLRFPLPILIPPTAPHSSIIRGWYSRPMSGGSSQWTHPMRKTITIQICLCRASSLTRGAVCPLWQVVASCTHSHLHESHALVRSRRLFTAQFSTQARFVIFCVSLVMPYLAY
jgi:hypothetical protein